MIAFDIDPVKLQCAQHNAEIYGVADKITFLQGSYFDLIKVVRADCVFLSPPWGGPEYVRCAVFDIKAMEPYGAVELLSAARAVTSNIVLYLPRQSSQVQIATLSPTPDVLELQYLNCSGSTKALCVYFGKLIDCA